MILWKDFLIDDEIGPTLMDPQTCRQTRECLAARPRATSVMEDANRGATIDGVVQETGQEKRPARMAGLIQSSDKTTSAVSRTGMDAGRELEVVSRQGGEV